VVSTELIPMPSYSLSHLLKEAEAEAAKIKGQRVQKTVAMFDLSGSTPLKLNLGHTLGTRTALQQNIVCRKIAERYQGVVVKELGDGVLIVFDDAVQACNAALDIKKATRKIKNCSTKAGLTSGYVEEVKIRGTTDFLGATVDRCARIQSVALPGQILIDKALLFLIESFLKDGKAISLSDPCTVELKGIGATEIYEMSRAKLGFVGWQQPFSIHEGRLPIQDKIKFMKSARTEVIEIGASLRTFANYFTGRPSGEFRDYVIDLLQNGVRFKCYVLDPKGMSAKMYAQDREEENLILNIQNSIDQLQNQAKELASLGLKGSLEVYVYDRLPYFYLMCVDPASENGKMAVSHYMSGILRADAPVIQFSKSSNPELFKKYWHSLQELTNTAQFMARISME
jgi:class 3 adenylate cyclase